MFKIIKVYKTLPNENYTGVIHMAKYINTENQDDNGIIFLEQTFSDDENLKKTSFIDASEEATLLDEKAVEEEFSVQINFQYGQGEMITAIKYDDKWDFLYDDEIGTSLGQKFPIGYARVGHQALNEMFTKLDTARDLVEADRYEEGYQSLERVKDQIASLRETVDGLEEQYAYMKKKRREDFFRKMDNK